MSVPTEVGPTRPLRVCLVVPYDLSPEAGGVKQHALHLLAALRRLGDEVWLIGPATKPVTTPGLQGFAGVVNIRHNGSDNQLGLLISPLKVWQFFRKHRFDIIHVHEPQSPLLPFWAAWLTPGIARVATFHAYAEDDAALFGRKALGALIFPWLKRAIAVSQPAKRYAQGSWVRPLTVIPNGVCGRVFRPAAEETPSVATEGPLKLMFVGRLADARKGARHMLEAYAKLRAQDVAVSLDMVGATDGFGPLPEMPGLTFSPDITTDDLARRYRATDVLVAPATGQESFGIILLEAMASAKPVICSNIDGFRGVACTTGTVFVPPGDTQALTQSIREMAGHSWQARRAMGEANLKHVKTYEWDSVVHKVRAEYLAAIEAVS